jgi:hypothetical protein
MLSRTEPKVIRRDGMGLRPVSWDVMALISGVKSSYPRKTGSSGVVNPLSP